VIDGLPSKANTAERCAAGTARTGVRVRAGADLPKLLLNERALLAAMAYVDLNPIRAKIATNLMGSRNTSIRLRCKAVRGNPELAGQPLMPICGVPASQCH
jgi:hypothetical protein